jgi:hypothetical protein
MFKFIRKELPKNLTLLLSSFVLIFSLSSQYLSANDIITKNTISDAEMAQLLAPIALYPDTLLTHILIASTYPVEVVEAHRWLSNNSPVDKQQIRSKVEYSQWDTSVAILFDFPSLLKKLSDELSWTQAIGQLFLDDQARVLASIQSLRKQANLAGSLNNMSHVNVTYERDVIIIEASQPNIIYIPYYNTRKVYGRWYWSGYPPITWSVPSVIGLSYGWFSWGQGVHINHHYYGNAFHWHKRYIASYPIKHKHFYTPRKRVVSHHAKRWSHQIKQKRIVSYGSTKYHKKNQNRVFTQTVTNRYNKPFISTHYNEAIKNKSLQVQHNRNKTLMRSTNKQQSYVQHKNYKAKINTAKNKSSNILSQRKVKKSHFMAKKSVTKKNTTKYLAKK